MDQLQNMRVFVRVAQHTGFAAAARDLRMSAGAVSKHVLALEARIGARLFDRTTRRVGLTEAGRVYLERCRECLHAVEDADASVRQLGEAPRGLLRVTAPIDLGAHVHPVLNRLLSTYPELRLDLQLSNRVVDMVEEGFDVGVRAAPALDGRYVARPLARTRLMFCATPEYLDEHGRPRRPEDLADHRTLVFAEPRPMHEFVFTRGRRQVRVHVTPVMQSNNGAALNATARAGLGLGIAPTFLAHDDLVAGRLEPVLLDWSLPEYRVFAVYPHRRFLSPKVSVFVAALRAEFGDGTRDPWWVESVATAFAARRSRPRALKRRVR